MRRLKPPLQEVRQSCDDEVGDRITEGRAGEHVAGPVGVEDVSQECADDRQRPECHGGVGIVIDKRRRERDSAGAVAGGEGLAKVGVSEAGAEEMPRMFPAGTDPPQNALEDQARDAGREDRRDDRDRPLPTGLWVQLPDEQCRNRRADRLAILREPAGFALDVAFEVELERGGETEALENKEYDAGGK